MLRPDGSPALATTSPRVNKSSPSAWPPAVRPQFGRLDCIAICSSAAKTNSRHADCNLLRTPLAPNPLASMASVEMTVEDPASSEFLPAEKQQSVAERRPPIYQSAELLQGCQEAWIEHGEQMYRLRLTHAGKLYLTK